MTSNKTIQHDISEVDDIEEFEIPQEFVSKVEDFEDKPKANLTESEIVNIESSEDIKETCVSIHLPKEKKEKYIQFLKKHSDVFAWSYANMKGLRTPIVAHRLPTDPSCHPVKKKLRNYKPELSLKIKEEISKQIDPGILRVTKYSTWLADVMPVSKKDGKVRVCVHYRDLNKASPKDDFPLPNIHILIDNCAKHETQSFEDCFTDYHQIKKHEDDAKKTAFITP